MSGLKHIDDHPLWFRIWWKVYLFFWFRMKMYRLLPKKRWCQSAIICDQSAAQSKRVPRDKRAMAKIKAEAKP